MNVDERRYFVAAKAVVVREGGDMLTLFRTESAPAHPLSWDLPGGILEWGEAVEECVIRETLEESGLAISLPRVFHAISRVNKIGEFWTTIYLVAYASSGEITLSFEHNDFKWIKPEEFGELEASKREKEGVARYVDFVQKGEL